jgi:plasmid replication initiation protein
MDKNKRTQELKKHVATIHCSNALTLLQRKISNALLYNAYRELLSRDEHEITIRKLCSLIGYNSNDHLTIKNALKNLISTVIEWNIIDETTSEQDWTASSILASARIKGSLCYYSYSARMRELLHSPAIYGRVSLIVQSKFKSAYGLAVYENCVRYKGLPNTRWFDLDVFRKLMGISESLYPIFRDLKRRVIDKAVEEVNTYSDMIVTPEIKRVGRKATAIRFLLKERVKKVRLGDNLIQENNSACNCRGILGSKDDLSQELRDDFGFTTKQIRKTLEKYDSQLIRDKIALIKASNSYIQGRVDNLTAYLLCALKNNYLLPTTSLERINKKRQNREEKEHLKKLEQLKQEERKKEYSEYSEGQINETIEKLTSNEKKQLEKEFEQFLLEPQNKTIYRFYEKDKFSNNIVNIFFREFFKKNYKHLLLDLLSFEEYSKIYFLKKGIN